MPGLLSDIVSASIPGLTRGVRTAMPYLESLSLQGSMLSNENIRALTLGTPASAASVLSANEIIRRLRSAGFGMNTQLALRAIKTFKRVIVAHQYIRDLTDGIKPLASAVPPAAFRQKFKYHIKVAVPGVDQFTGEPVVQYVTVVRTHLITKAEAKAEALLMVLEGESYGAKELGTPEIVTYTRQNSELQ